MEHQVIILLILFSAYFAQDLEDETNKKFQHDCLTEHNRYRKNHHVRALKLDQKLVTLAKKRCHKIATTNDKGIPPDASYGENRYWEPGEEPATCKYREAKRYDYKKNKGGGTFTQVIWKSTTRVGCARCTVTVECDESDDTPCFPLETNIVCNYQPPGNFAGKFIKNVRKI